MDILTVLFWSLAGSVFSLIGGILLLGSAKARKAAIRFGLPFGAGALLAAAFAGLLPEALEGGDMHTTGLYVLGGFLAFFVLERFLGWFHHHGEHHHGAELDGRNKAHQWLVIIGDTLHNAIDGVAVGAAFLVSPAAGVGTALAVAAHEIPQEIGDFSILLGKGMKPTRVILVNVLSALATVVAALATYILGGAADFNPAALLAIAAGFFIYIAASDIIPDIHEKPRREGNIQAAMLLVGVLAITFAITAAPHDHGHEGDAHGPEHSTVEAHEHGEQEDEHAGSNHVDAQH